MKTDVSEPSTRKQRHFHQPICLSPHQLTDLSIFQLMKPNTPTKKLPSFQYELDEPLEENCHLCLKTIETESESLCITSCNHVYHAKCIRNYNGPYCVAEACSGDITEIWRYDRANKTKFERVRRCTVQQRQLPSLDDKCLVTLYNFLDERTRTNDVDQILMVSYIARNVFYDFLTSGITQPGAYQVHPKLRTSFRQLHTRHLQDNKLIQYYIIFMPSLKCIRGVILLFLEWAQARPHDTQKYLDYIQRRWFLVTMTNACNRV
jgi:hypothetical protein